MRTAFFSCLALAASASAQSNPLCNADFAFDGNLTDSGANAYHGQMIGPGGTLAGPGNFATGKSGLALRLEGNAALRIPVDLNYELCPQITISAWFYMEDPTTRGREYLLSTGNGSGVGMYRDRRNIVARGGRAALNKDVIRPNQWTFIAVVLDYPSNTLTLYWGNRSAQAALSPEGLLPGLPDLIVGAFDDAVQSQYTVKSTLIDDLRIAGSALDATAIAATRTQSRASAPLVAGNSACPAAACSAGQVCFEGGCYGPCSDDTSRLCRQSDPASPVPGTQAGLAANPAGAYQSPAAGILSTNPEASPAVQTQGGVATNPAGAYRSPAGDMLSPSSDDAAQLPPDNSAENGGMMGGGQAPGSVRGRGLTQASGIACEEGVCPMSQTCVSGQCYVDPVIPTPEDTRTQGQILADGARNAGQIVAEGVDEARGRVDEYLDTHMEFLDQYGKAAECHSIWGLAEKVRDDLAGAAAALGCHVTPASWINVVDCLKVKRKVQEFDDAKLDLWNILLANGSWANVGPRKLKLGTPQAGNIVGVFARTWVTYDYLETDSVRLEISEPADSGRLMTDIRVCKVDKQGAITLLDHFVVNDDSRSRGLTEFFSKTFAGLEDRQLIVSFKGTGVPDPGRRLPYTIEAIPVFD